MSKINELFAGGLKIVNLGIASFYDDLTKQNEQVVQVAWRPPAGGNEKMAELLKRLK